MEQDTRTTGGELGRRMASKRQWTELELVCTAGVGLESVAPDICRLLREMTGADAGALFWMDETGLPAGFFHEDSSPAVRDLFANAFEALFTGESELNVATLITRRDRALGHLIAPPAEYWQSNTYNLLVRASGHHHTMDLRVDEEGAARAVLLLFRARARPGFDTADLEILRLAQPVLRRALRLSPAPLRWRETGASAHLLVDRTGTRLLFSSPSATGLLQQANLVAQGVPVTGALVAPPAFAPGLCATLSAGGRAACLLAVPAGRLQVTAEALDGAGGEAAVLLTLRHQAPDRLRIVQRVLGLDLSPRQKSILMAAAGGASRLDAARQTGTSPEAMKKHLATIFEATGVRAWGELARVVGDGPAG